MLKQNILAQKVILAMKKRKGVINKKLKSYKPIEDCSDGIVKKNQCLKDFCIINKSTWDDEGNLILDEQDARNRNKLFGYDVKIPYNPCWKSKIFKLLR